MKMSQIGDTDKLKSFQLSDARSGPRKIVQANCLEVIKAAAREIFSYSSAQEFKVHLDDDTLVDDDEYLNYLPDFTYLFLTRSGDRLVGCDKCSTEIKRCCCYPSICKKTISTASIGIQTEDSSTEIFYNIVYHDSSSDDILSDHQDPSITCYDLPQTEVGNEDMVELDQDQIDQQAKLVDSGQHNLNQSSWSREQSVQQQDSSNRMNAVDPLVVVKSIPCGIDHDDAEEDHGQTDGQELVNEASIVKVKLEEMLYDYHSLNVDPKVPTVVEAQGDNCGGSFAELHQRADVIQSVAEDCAAVLRGDDDVDRPSDSFHDPEHRPIAPYIKGNPKRALKLSQAKDYFRSGKFLPTWGNSYQIEPTPGHTYLFLVDSTKSRDYMKRSLSVRFKNRGFNVAGDVKITYFLAWSANKLYEEYKKVEFYNMREHKLIMHFYGDDSNYEWAPHGNSGRAKRRHLHQEAQEDDIYHDRVKKNKDDLKSYANTNAEAQLS